MQLQDDFLASHPLVFAYEANHEMSDCATLTSARGKRFAIHNQLESLLHSTATDRELLKQVRQAANVIGLTREESAYLVSAMVPISAFGLGQSFRLQVKASPAEVRELVLASAADRATLMAALASRAGLRLDRLFLSTAVGEDLECRTALSVYSNGLRALLAMHKDEPDLQAQIKSFEVRMKLTAAQAAKAADLAAKLNLENYPASFATARRLRRKVTLFVGPPNSGKTHAAFDQLEKAQGRGLYLAPLRLLALEGRDRLEQRGVKCDLRTGEEVVRAEGSSHVSSTVEMLPVDTIFDVAVLDEAQMLHDVGRGWAWTQALLGTAAHNFIIICSEYASASVCAVLSLVGETPDIRTFERKQQLQQLPRPLELAELTEHDALVAFSRKEVLQLRKRLLELDKSVSVIYGSLSPEVRRNQAALFAGGSTDILVATDAIGMGLNLPIKRIVFSAVHKFDGEGQRELTASEIQQIAGRAGRFGYFDAGQVGVLSGRFAQADMTLLRQKLAAAPHPPANFRAFVAPNDWHVTTIARQTGQDKLWPILSMFAHKLELETKSLCIANLDAVLSLSQMLDGVAGRLDLPTRFSYAQAPVDVRTPEMLEAFLVWARAHGNIEATGTGPKTTFVKDYEAPRGLVEAETGLKLCTLWLWLAQRFPGVYTDVETVMAHRGKLNAWLDNELGKNPEGSTERP